MSLIYTPMTDPKFSIPKFNLPTVAGGNLTNSDLKKDVKIFLFICNHCPYVQAIESRIINLAKSYRNKNVEFVAICSNNAKDYPEDSFEAIKYNWENKNFGFPYLYDETQSVAKIFDAVCTPDIFVFDEKNFLFYRGRFDNNWKSESKVTRQELQIAIDDCLKKSPLSFDPQPSMGCSIKWK